MKLQGIFQSEQVIGSKREVLISATGVKTGKSAVAFKRKGVTRAEPGLDPGWILGEH
jgi:hypothetical protein